VAGWEIFLLCKPRQLLIADETFDPQRVLTSFHCHSNAPEGVEWRVEATEAAGAPWLAVK
jgi:hypothetical protein